MRFLSPAILILSILILSVHTTVIEQPRSLLRAPYILNRVETQHEIRRVIEDAQSWYQWELTSFAENVNLLPTSQRQSALDKLMKVFCTDDKFRGYIGITLDGQLFTNRTYVSTLYDSFPSGTDMTFNAASYSQVVTPLSSGRVREVHVNATAFLRLIAKSDVLPLSIFHGSYQNEWIIDADGWPCIARFHDRVTKWFMLNGTQMLSIPWNL